MQITTGIRPGVVSYPRSTRGAWFSSWLHCAGPITEVIAREHTANEVPLDLVQRASECRPTPCCFAACL